MKSHKDLFSKQSQDYAKYRPTYPPQLYEFLATLPRERQTAWDCGTGNGQAAVQLAAFFERVFATDLSDKQLAMAMPHGRVTYRRAIAEESILQDASVDLIVVAQAFHWFQASRFFAEVRRVQKPGGVLAVWCYELCRISPEIDAVVDRLYKDILSGYWEPERQLVEEGYRNVEFPFDPIVTPRFEMRARWNIEHMIGYLRTWSALQTYVKKNGIDPLPEIQSDLRQAWGKTADRDVVWELSVRAFRTVA